MGAADRLILKIKRGETPFYRKLNNVIRALCTPIFRFPAFSGLFSRPCTACIWPYFTATGRSASSSTGRPYFGRDALRPERICT